MTETSTPPSIDPASAPGATPGRAGLLGRISRLEIVVGAVTAVIMVLLVLLEPDILEAPFENGRTLLFTFGGTAIAAVAFVAMLRLRVPAPVRLVVLVVPFAVVNWWLISPYFVDDVVDEGFTTSISEQLATGDAPLTPAVSVPNPASGSAVRTAPPTADAPVVTTEPALVEPVTPSSAAVEQEASAEAPPSTEAPAEPAAPAPAGPVLLGAGQFVGLAGHSGTGDAGIFRNEDGSLVLRFENFDIENGPDLEVYLVPGADQTDLAEGAIHLGALKGNIGDQNYDLPPELAPGTYTALVWCEAFGVEFVGATLSV